MARVPRIASGATAIAVMIVATTVTQPSAIAADPRPGPAGLQAEVQIGLCAPPDRLVQALGLRPRGSAITVWQFDDSALSLLGHGLRLRLRVAANERSEFTLKVAGQDCAQIDRKRVPSSEGKCEYDAYGKSTVGVVSLNRSLDAKSTNDLLAGRATPAQLLSPSQSRYLREVVGVWPLPTGIRGLGPMQVQTYRTKDRLYDIDISRLPGGELYAEISRKVRLDDATRTMGVMEADLSRAGIELCADQASQAGNKLRALLR